MFTVTLNNNFAIFFYDMFSGLYYHFFNWCFMAGVVLSDLRKEAIAMISLSFQNSANLESKSD